MSPKKWPASMPIFNTTITMLPLLRQGWNISSRESSASTEKKQPPFSGHGNAVKKSKQTKLTMAYYHNQLFFILHSSSSRRPPRQPRKLLGILRIGTNSPNRSADCPNESVFESIRPLTFYAEVFFCFTSTFSLPISALPKNQQPLRVSHVATQGFLFSDWPR